MTSLAACTSNLYTPKNAEIIRHEGFCEGNTGPEVRLSPSADAGTPEHSRAAKAVKVTLPGHAYTSKMSLPGLDLSAPVETFATPTVHELKEQTEWRFEVAFGTKVEVRV